MRQDLVGNSGRYREDRAARMSTWKIDCSERGDVPGWAEHGEEAFCGPGPRTYDPLIHACL